jgi:hypothetical protein
LEAERITLRGKTVLSANANHEHIGRRAFLKATLGTAGVNPRARHDVGTRPIWATPEGSHVVRELIA